VLDLLIQLSLQDAYLRLFMDIASDDVSPPPMGGVGGNGIVGEAPPSPSAVDGCSDAKRKATGDASDASSPSLPSAIGFIKKSKSPSSKKSKSQSSKVCFSNTHTHNTLNTWMEYLCVCVY